MAKSTTKDKASFGCLILFLLPFLVAGIGCLVKGVLTYMEKPEFTEEVIAMFGVGGIFTLVGGGFIAGVFYAKRKAAEDKVFQDANPDTPWLWQQNWAEGRIKSSTPITMFILWLFAIVFSGFGSVIIFKLDEMTDESKLAYLVLLFPLVGVIMFIQAIYATLRWIKYGRVYCDLVTKPGVIGGWFQGIIWAKINMAPGENVKALITCYHCYTSGSGDNRSSHRNVKWQETFTIPQERMMVQNDGTLAIPVKVYIPRDCKPTTPASPEDRFEWELSVEAEVAGIDFKADFIIPVFVTEESSDTPPANVEEESFAHAPAPYTPTILINENINGVEIYAPPRRGLSALFSITLFSIIWTAIVVGMIGFADDIPFIFPIVFGFFNILIVTAAIWMWLGKVRVRIEFGNIHVHKTVLGLGSRKSYSVNEINDVDTHINMQSRKTPYYTVRLHTTTGKKSTVGGIRNKDEAEDIVKRIKDALQS